jgi:hypothetical protein
MAGGRWLKSRRIYQRMLIADKRIQAHGIRLHLHLLQVRVSDLHVLRRGFIPRLVAV